MHVTCGGEGALRMRAVRRGAVTIVSALCTAPAVRAAALSHRTTVPLANTSAGGGQRVASNNTAEGYVEMGRQLALAIGQLHGVILPTQQAQSQQGSPAAGP